jgi:hypothetical protein
MSPPEVWGPPIWTLFHVLAEKINEHMYPFYAGQLFNIVKQICSALPCPECTNDATIVLSKIKIQDLKTKEDFKKMIYIFHNYVNAKKRKPLYNYSSLEVYQKYNIINVFNRFISVYHTRGNMKLLAESFQRQNIIKHIKEWFSKNIIAFVPVQSPPAPSVSQEIKPIIQDESFVIIEEMADESIQHVVNGAQVDEAQVDEVQVGEMQVDEPPVDEEVNTKEEEECVKESHPNNDIIPEVTQSTKAKKGRKKKH